jgi:catechol 2,3-dioxygenase-like lactoylglutathione lyase family enzyme
VAGIEKASSLLRAGCEIDAADSRRDDRSVPPLPPAGVYETIVDVKDIAAAVAFYRDVIGLALVDGPDHIGAGFRLQSGSMLLIFDPRRSSIPGRPAPSHRAQGAGHVAFRVDQPQISSWRVHFQALGVEIEKDTTSEDGVEQLYVRDPSGNSVEIVAGELWR